MMHLVASIGLSICLPSDLDIEGGLKTTQVFS